MPIFKCPQCGAKPNEHGKGACAGGNRDDCDGFLCNCFEQEGFVGEDHGEVPEKPCKAYCHHCDWAGIMPQPKFDPKLLIGWPAEALKAKWMPPADWMPTKAQLKDPPRPKLIKKGIQKRG